MAKRRHHRRRKAVRSFATNPVRRRHRRIRHRRYRRNPLPSSVGGFMDNTLLPAAIGAGGAIGVDFLMATLAPMLPASISQGAMLPLVRIGMALGLGYVVGEVAGERIGEQVAAGGVLVAVYSAAKSFMSTNVPSVPLARYVPMGYIGPARTTMNGVRPRVIGQRRLALIRQRRAFAQGNNGGMGGGIARFIAPTRNQIMRGMSRYMRN